MLVELISPCNAFAEARSRATSSFCPPTTALCQSRFPCSALSVDNIAPPKLIYTNNSAPLRLIFSQYFICQSWFPHDASLMVSNAPSIESSGHITSFISGALSNKSRLATPSQWIRECFVVWVFMLRYTYWWIRNAPFHQRYSVDGSDKSDQLIRFIQRCFPQHVV